MSPQRPRRADAVTAWESLFRAQVAVLRRLSADDIWDELSMREYDVLFALSRSAAGRLRLGELTEQVLLSQPSLSRMAERLELRGLVAREAAPGDRRGTVVRLTDAGRAAQRRTGLRHAACIKRLMGGALDAGELAELIRLADALRDAAQRPAGLR